MGKETINEIIEFWTVEHGPPDWYKQDPAFDAEIRAKFLGAWQAALAGKLEKWRTCAPGALAYIILTDQFPRNMFRGHSDSFATDRQAKAAAKQAIHRKWDKRIDEPARQFFYMPLMHAECQLDQDRAVRMFLTRMPETGDENLPHARVHREIIRLFGRFPYRNDALGRESSQAEAAFLDGPGYQGILNSLDG